MYCTTSGQVFLSALPQHEFANFMASAPWEPLTRETLTRSEGASRTPSESEEPGLCGQRGRVHRRGGAMVSAMRIYADRIRRAIQPRCPSTAEGAQAAHVASWL
ncbi:hypothetical protein [Variovorax sp. 160MFSha2.1]|uniref:hypothetical protein n=1 Tax=Variovorax sp. 160MFSha2.1 TaxID=3158367 RepID=UPI003AB07C08